MTKQDHMDLEAFSVPRCSGGIKLPGVVYFHGTVRPPHKRGREEVREYIRKMRGERIAHLAKFYSNMVAIENQLSAFDGQGNLIASPKIGGGLTRKPEKKNKPVYNLLSLLLEKAG